MVTTNWRSVVAGALLVALLAACGGPGSTPAVGPDPAPQAADEPVTLTIAVHQDIQHWDPHNHNYTFTEAVHQNVFDYLVRMDPETGEFAPDLATSWRLVEPTVWEFQLRENVKFHNGLPFTAEDVKFTVERVAFDTSLKEQRTMATVKEVQIVDSHTVRIVTHEPDPVLLNRLSRIGSGIMSKAHWEAVGGLEGWQKDPVGTGPFKFESWVKDESITLVAFDEHWRGRPQIDKVVFRVIPEVATRVAELQSGGVDIALRIGVDNAQTVSADPGLTTASGLTNRVWLLMVRTQRDYVTGNPLVREAIELAVDRNALISVAEPGLGVPTRTRNTPGITGADPSLYNQDLYNPARAKELLAEAGYPDGGVPIGLLARSGGTDAIIAQALAGMLEEVGFQVNLEMLDATAFTNRLNAATTPEIYLNAFGNSMKDAEIAYTFLTTAIDIERIGYAPQDLVDLYQATKSEMDAARRAEMFSQIARRVADDRPQIALFQSGEVHGIRKGIEWKPTRDEMLWVYDIRVTR